MSTTGPVPALPTLEDVEAKANDGEYESGQIVYVHEIQDYAIIWSASPSLSIVTRLIFPSLVIFEEETEDLPRFTPALVTAIEGRPAVPVLTEDCGTIFTQEASLPGSSIRSGNSELLYTSLDHLWESSITPISDPPTIDASTVS